jgi:phosphate uptake regulator
MDVANREMLAELRQLMHDDPAGIERVVQALSSSHNLERIADRGTNIADESAS